MFLYNFKMSTGQISLQAQQELYWTAKLYNCEMLVYHNPLLP